MTTTFGGDGAAGGCPLAAGTVCSAIDAAAAVISAFRSGLVMMGPICACFRD